MIIYPDKDYSNVFYIQGRHYGKTQMLLALREAIIKAKLENRPVEVECITRMIKIED